MRILFINSVYKEKSTGAIVKSLSDYARSRGHETLSVYGRGKKKEDAIRNQGFFSFLINVLLSRIVGKTWNCFARKQTKRIIKIIESYKPDIVNIHQSFGYYMNPSLLFNYLKSHNIKTVVTLHDFTLLSGKCGYPLNCSLFKDGCHNCPRKHEYPKSWFFDNTKEEYNEKAALFNSSKNFIFVAVSDWLAQMAKMSKITNNSYICNINNGIDIDFYKFESKKNKDKLVVVVSSNYKDEIKGGKLLKETIRKVQQIDGNVSFALIGKHSDYIKRSLRNITNIISLGLCSKNEVRYWFNKAMCSFIPSQLETFSLPTIESICCGVPVFGPKGCGAPEYLLKHKYCNFDYGRDPTSIANAICDYCNSPASDSELLEFSNLGRKLFDVKNMNQKYIDMFEKFLKNENQ